MNPTPSEERAGREQRVTKASIDGMASTPLGNAGWDTFRKKTLTRALRMEGAFTVETREGEVRCENGWLAIDAHGWPYPIAADEFEAIYERVAAVTPPDHTTGSGEVLICPSCLDASIAFESCNGVNALHRHERVARVRYVPAQALAAERERGGRTENPVEVTVYDETSYEKRMKAEADLASLREQYREIVEAARFALAALEGVDHRKGQPCGEDACWLCGAQETLRNVLTSHHETMQDALSRVPRPEPTENHCPRCGGERVEGGAFLHEPSCGRPTGPDSEPTPEPTEEGGR